jgi:hypothetical protein
MTLRITIICNEFHYAEGRYAQYHISFIVLLNVFVLSDVVLSVFMLSVVAPTNYREVVGSNPGAKVKITLVKRSIVQARFIYNGRKRNRLLIFPARDTLHFLRNLQMGPIS